MVLPVVTLATFLVPNFILVMRISVLETAREQFVITARARGAGPARRVVAAHPAQRHQPGGQPDRPAAWPSDGRRGRSPRSIFAWPGVGRLMVSAIFQRDVPIVIAAVFIVALTIVLANLAVDLVQAAIDPRIRLR